MFDDDGDVGHRTVAGCDAQSNVKARSNPSDTLRNGLSIEDNQQLMTSQDISEIGGLIEKGLKKLSRELAHVP